MLNRIILFIVLSTHLSACSPLHTRDIRTHQENQEYSETHDPISTGRRILAFPFYAIGGIAMVIGSIVILAADSENYESEKQSEGENGLLGLGFFAGGFLLWEIGETISGDQNKQDNQSVHH